MSAIWDTHGTVSSTEIRLQSEPIVSLVEKSCVNAIETSLRARLRNTNWQLFAATIESTAKMQEPTLMRCKVVRQIDELLCDVKESGCDLTEDMQMLVLTIVETIVDGRFFHLVASSFAYIQICESTNANICTLTNENIIGKNTLRFLCKNSNASIATNQRDIKEDQKAAALSKKNGSFFKRLFTKNVHTI